MIPKSFSQSPFLVLPLLVLPLLSTRSLVLVYEDVEISQTFQISSLLYLPLPESIVNYDVFFPLTLDTRPNVDSNDSNSVLLLGWQTELGV
jgi:hypothetical protein